MNPDLKCRCGYTYTEASFSLEYDALASTLTVWITCPECGEKKFAMLSPEFFVDYDEDY